MIHLIEAVLTKSTLLNSLYSHPVLLWRLVKYRYHWRATYLRLIDDQCIVTCSNICLANLPPVLAIKLRDISYTLSWNGWAYLYAAMFSSEELGPLYHQWIGPSTELLGLVRIPLLRTALEPMRTGADITLYYTDLRTELRSSKSREITRMW